jgi:hypothetical protein
MEPNEYVFSGCFFYLFFFLIFLFPFSVFLFWMSGLQDFLHTNPRDEFLMLGFSFAFFPSFFPPLLGRLDLARSIFRQVDEK